jgi:hypothetical protein
MTIDRLLRVAVLAVGIAIGTCGRVSAQVVQNSRPAEAGKFVAITVALTEQEEPPLVFRRQSPPYNVILVNAERISAEELANAVYLLTSSERFDPTGIRRSDAVAMRVSGVSFQGDVSRDHSWADRVVAGLRTASEVNISSIGIRRALEIWVARDLRL